MKAEGFIKAKDYRLYLSQLFMLAVDRCLVCSKYKRLRHSQKKTQGAMNQLALWDKNLFFPGNLNFSKFEISEGTLIENYNYSIELR